jgi:hypothetical protein
VKRRVKMKKYSVILSVIMVFAVASQASAISFVIGGAPGDGGYTSPYAGAIVETFDGAGQGWTFSDNYIIRDGSTSGIAAAPWCADTNSADATNYLSVPEDINMTPQSATIDFGASYNYFGLWWGSMDTYNTLTFLDGSTVVATVSGLTFSSGNGDQMAAATNQYVNFFDMPDFTAVMLTSTQYAFEVDNIAVGNNVAPVPEPTTLLLLGTGLLGLAGFRKKTK